MAHGTESRTGQDPIVESGGLSKPRSSRGNEAHSTSGFLPPQVHGISEDKRFRLLFSGAWGCFFSTKMILVLDNYDSFTYNLVQYLGELGVDLQVKRNDETTLDAIRAL